MMKAKSEVIPIACAQPASAAVRKPRPATKQAPADLASRPGAEAERAALPGFAEVGADSA